MAASDDLLMRYPAWEAFSQLFLDTELDDADYQRLAKDLAATPYSIEQLRHIAHHEVAPVCGPNLLAVTGAWDKFDKQWLIQRCSRFQKANKKPHATGIPIAWWHKIAETFRWTLPTPPFASMVTKDIERLLILTREIRDKS